MDRVAWWAFRALAALVRALSLESGFRLGHTLGGVAYYLAGPYRRLALHNLRIAFGREKTEAEIAVIAREHFRNLGANLFSSLKLPTLSQAQIEAVVTVEGLAQMEPQLLKKSGFVFIVSHLGNWEMWAQLTPIIFRCKVGAVYQRLGNHFLDAEIRRDRARLGFELFERKEGFTRAARFIREGGAVGVLADQHAGDAGLWCPFFDRLASTSTLAATLAMRTGGALMPAAVYTVGVARWRCVFSPPIDPSGHTPETLTARVNELIEELIRVRPADWFWVHNRWKLPRPNFLLTGYKRGVLVTDHRSPITDHRSPSESLQPFRMVIRSSNWLGDAVMSAPAVRAIKAGRPDAHVTILTPAKLADFWRAVPDVDDVLPITPGESVFQVARRLRGSFEVAIIFPNSLRTALEPWLAGIPRRVGFPGHRRAWLLNQVLREKKSKKAQPAAPLHQTDHYLALARYIGADVSAPSDHRSPITDHDSPITIHHSPPILGVCPGAEYGPAKRWLPERFADVMRTVHERTGCEWRIFGVPKDRELTDTIVQSAAVPCTDLVGKTTLAELIQQLRECDLLVTNDTGTMHLAAFLGVRVVAIFGSTEPALTAPSGDGHTILRRHVECSPCFLRECPIDFRCMKAVSVESVVAAVEASLGVARETQLNNPARRQSHAAHVEHSGTHPAGQGSEHLDPTAGG